MGALHSFSLVLASLLFPGTTSIDVATNQTQEWALGLRPKFEQLLGKEAVDEFIAGAWKRSVTEIDVMQEKTTTPHLTATALYRPDGNYGYSHHRFDALGPVLQCPPSIFSKFGEGDDEKHICGLPGDSNGEVAIVANGINNKQIKCK